jgi:hypothetical protein
MAPVTSVHLTPAPLGTSPVNTGMLRRGGALQIIDIAGEGSCAGVVFTAGVGFGAGIRQSGVRATARLQLSGPATGWRFGFIQFLRQRVFDITFRGATRGDGATHMQFYPVSSQSQLQIDQCRGADARQPWYHANCVKSAADASSGALTIEFNDTPADFVECRRLNRNVNNSSNWLHHVWFRLSFTTVLAAQSPAGAVEPLQAFTWSVDWNQTFTRGSGANPDDNWTWTANPGGKIVDSPRSASGTGLDAAIAACFNAPTFRMLTTVDAAEASHQNPRLQYFASW